MSVWYWSVWISGPALREHMKLQVVFRIGHLSINVDEGITDLKRILLNLGTRCLEP